MSFQSAWSTNAVSICRSCGVDAVSRLEVSRRFLLRSQSTLSSDTLAAFSALVSVTFGERVTWLWGSLPHLVAFLCLEIS